MDLTRRNWKILQ